MRFVLKAVLWVLICALAYVLLNTFGYSADNIGWFIVGVFNEYRHVFLHPIALLIMAIFLVVALINMMKQR